MLFRSEGQPEKEKAKEKKKKGNNVINLPDMDEEDYIAEISNRANGYFDSGNRPIDLINELERMHSSGLYFFEKAGTDIVHITADENIAMAGK